ncbi:MAG: DUF3473 domain-containing protein [Rubrivivax sp.]|nr:MAG: DUF3473 domain-containing protein [Rubrivivax sp.]
MPSAEMPDVEARMEHAFTIDVEDWYHGGPDGLACDPTMSRLAHGLDRLLDLLQSHGCRATFFWLGAAAAENPRLLRKVLAQGHEVGFHGYHHRPVYGMSASAFREDAAMAIDTIEQIGGASVAGYRAPYFSLTLDTPWAFEVLAELGVAYDSSVFPGRRGARVIQPHHSGPQVVETRAGRIAELPMASCRWGPVVIPACGGAYFRLYPYALTRRNLRWLERSGRFANFYIHPWELDPDHPRLPSTWKQALAHELGLKKVEARLVRLLSEFRFTTLGEKLAQAVAGPKPLPSMRWS